MKYKKKARILTALVAVLALVYILSFIFDPGRDRAAAFAWLDPSLLDLADRIEITGASGTDGGASRTDGGGGSILLVRRNNKWVYGAGAYPVKQQRVKDLLSVLSKKEAYALRAASLAGAEKLGFPGGPANQGPAYGAFSRILVRGGPGLPLLDLLVGGVDALGREIYLKRADKKEVYSGEDRFTLYTESRPAFWFDLRLFMEEIAVSAVQQAEVFLPPAGAGPEEYSYVLRRGGGGWLIPGNGAALDGNRVEAWLRSVLEAEGEDFATGPQNFGDALQVSGGRITLRLGDGTSRAISFGAEDGQKRRIASVSASAGEPRLYAAPALLLNERTLVRLFRDSSYFIP